MAVTGPQVVVKDKVLTVRVSVCLQCTQAVGHTDDPPRVRLLEQVHRRGECAREEVVVGVDVGDDVAGGHADPAVDRRGLAVVGLARPPRDLLVEALEDVGRAVGRTAVEHEVLEVVVALLDDRPDRLLQELRLVERRRDDRQLHAARRRTNSPSE